MLQNSIYILLLLKGIVIMALWLWVDFGGGGLPPLRPRPKRFVGSGWECAVAVCHLMIGSDLERWCSFEHFFVVYQIRGFIGRTAYVIVLWHFATL